MRAVTLGRLLLLLGLFVGLAAAVGLLVGLEPSRLPAALIDVVAYKLAFIAALGLLAVGAGVLRRARGAASEARASDRAKVG